MHTTRIFPRTWCRLIVTCALVMGTVLLQAQSNTFVPVAPESLSSTFVRCIYKDSWGFMWFGTGNGLVRYDGTNVYRYEHKPNYGKSISSNRINTIVEDLNKTLWIGTSQGLVKYDREKDFFIDIDSIGNGHLSNRYISALCIDEQGKLWIGTLGNGLNVYNSKTQTITYLADSIFRPDASPEHYVTSLFAVEDTLWAGTKGGLKMFNTKFMQPLPLSVSEKSISSKEITQVIRDPSSGNVWLSTADREIIKLSIGREGWQIDKTKLEQNGYAQDAGTIMTLSIDAAHNLWIGGENSGLSYVNAKNLAITFYEAGEGDKKKLPTNSIRSIYVDNTGITWIGTYNKGVYLVDNNAKKFHSIGQSVVKKNGVTSNNIKGLVQDGKGNVWFAADGGGLGKVDVLSDELKYEETINEKLGTRYLSALLYDSSGNLWIGTWGRGVYKLNLKNQSLQNYELKANGFGDNKVFCLHMDKKKNIWAGTVGSGLFCLQPNANEFVSLYDEKKTDRIANNVYITSIQEDPSGKLWVGTAFGLFELTIGIDKSYNFTWHSTLRGDFFSNDIQTIYVDEKQNLWFGTGDNGLVVLPRHSILFKSVQVSSLNKAARAIRIDAKGDMWISGNRGLSKYNPDTKSFRNYSIEDGLPSNEFNANVCMQASNGKFYFGSDNGIVAFFPDSIRNNAIKPLVYLTDLKLNNQPVQIGAEDSPLDKHISLTSSIELTYNQRSFVIDFVAINYGQSSKNEYCYRLEGFDQNWNCSGSSRSAIYTNIDPGHYVFYVKASTSDGISSDEPAKLEITIHPAPWKTWWAILSYVVLSVSLIIFFVKVRIERITIKNLLELERLAREKEHALSESKNQFFTNISHEFRTPLSLIVMPLENLISMHDLPASVKERLATIRTSSDKMTRLVNELMDFNKLESEKLKLYIQHGELVQFITEIATVFNDLAEKKQIHFGVHSMVKSLDGWFDHDKLEKILVNVLSNAFKFTADNGAINITINSKYFPVGEEQIRWLELVIVDNGIGISEEELPFIFDKFYQAKSSAKIGNPGTGIGLSLTKGLVELHRGSITAESAPDHETTFIIHIPIDRQVYEDESIIEIPGYLNAQPVSNGIEMNDSLAYSGDGELGHDDKPQILVVEDNDELRKYISRELRQQFNVFEAIDGKEGLEIALEKSPDLIISDILMPVKTGIELCAEIKSNLKTSHIPFLLLTAKTTTEDQIAGIATGADLYITKPFSIRFLIAHVNQIIASRQKLYSRFSQDVYLMPSKIASNEIDEAFLQKAIDYIIYHIQDPQLGVDSMASLFNLSRMQVYRKIKALTGKPVVDFIRMIRIKQALKLMETQKYTLSEIAFQTGFNSASYFTKCFKDHYGKAPSEYLDSSKQNG